MTDPLIIGEEFSSLKTGENSDVKQKNEPLIIGRSYNERRHVKGKVPKKISIKNPRKKFSDKLLANARSSGEEGGTISESSEPVRQKSTNFGINNNQLLRGSLSPSNRRRDENRSTFRRKEISTDVKEFKKEDSLMHLNLSQVENEDQLREFDNQMVRDKYESNNRQIHDKKSILNNFISDKEELTGFQIAIFIIAFTVTASILLSAIITFSNTRSAKEDYDKLLARKDEIIASIESATSIIETLKERIAETEKEIAALKHDITLGNSSYKELNIIHAANEKKINMLQLAKKVLQIGIGGSLALGIGATGVFYYEFTNALNIIMSNDKLANEIKMIKDKLPEITLACNHYNSYFSTALMKTIEINLVHANNGNYTKTLIYESSDGFDAIELGKVLKGRNLTTVTGTTNKGWIMSGFLSARWNINDYTGDESALLLAVSRGEETVLPRENAEYAARFVHKDNSAYIEFGEGDIIIYENFTGKTKAGNIYKPVNPHFDPDRFYANETEFVLSSMAVHKYAWNL